MSTTIIHQITYPCSQCGGGPALHRRTPHGFVCLCAHCESDEHLAEDCLNGELCQFSEYGCNV